MTLFFRRSLTRERYDQYALNNDGFKCSIACRCVGYHNLDACIGQVLPKPNKAAQTVVEGAKKVLLSDVYGTTKRRLFLNRSWGKVDLTYCAFMFFIHGLCLFAPATFSWRMVGLFLISYFISGKLTPFAHTSLVHTRCQLKTDTHSWNMHAANSVQAC